MKVHCFFEQSGTFRDEFRKLQIESYDYDIRNDFYKTDYIVDLFDEIEKCTAGEKNIFDSFEKDDLILAFFPCTYFSTLAQFDLQLNRNKCSLPVTEKIDYAIQALRKRTHYHIILLQLIKIVTMRNLKLIVENPATTPNYLLNGNFVKPTIIDYNRRMHGDFLQKPTAFWFFNCAPTGKMKLKKTNVKRHYRDSRGIARSLISSDYAANFIANCILGLNPCSDPYQLELNF